MLSDLLPESSSSRRGEAWRVEIGPASSLPNCFFTRCIPATKPPGLTHGPSPRGKRGRIAAASAALAAAALLAELEAYPKPGLVSLIDSGSHDDMDAGTFRRSIAAIEPFFAQLACASATGAPLAALRAIGLDAEAAMLAATGGVNTHRGTIFALGLLCAAAGTGCDDPAGYVREAWGGELAGERPSGGSHGAGAMRRFGVGGARGEAAAGFPGATRVGLPALREGRRLASASILQDPFAGRSQVCGSFRAHWAPNELGDWTDRPIAMHGVTPTPSPSPQGGGARVEEAARVQAFFALLAHLDDTNLLHRGGAEGLAFAQSSAQTFLDAGGVGAPDWRAHAVAIHDAFVARRLSPGGSADLLAVTLFLDGCAA